MHALKKTRLVALAGSTGCPLDISPVIESKRSLEKKNEKNEN
jgi:hypothetical protein